jgi:hypothetical protein
MRPRRPINADLPPAIPPSEGAAEAAEGDKARVEKGATEAHKPRRLPRLGPPKPRRPKLGRAGRRRPRQPVPGTLIALGALAALAVLFILVAVLAGRDGGSAPQESPAPAPSSAGAAKQSEPVTQSAGELGYPTFATDNTTRVGGSDASANAAAVALAVYPSATPSQRPAAVTLVSEEDWAGALAAAVLMAPPVRAPLLFSTPDELPQASAEALDALAPRGSPATQGAAIFAVGAVALPDGAVGVSRVDSGDPASTAAQISTLRDRVFGDSATAFVLAPSSRPDLAMPAAAWAARSGDPVLYSDPKRLPQPTAAVLERHPKASVYVLGPRSAISDRAMGEVAKIVKRVKRVGEQDPVANAVAFARYGDGGFGWNVNDPGHGFVLARSDSPTQAAAAAALSASGTWGPLLLTDDAGTLPADVRSYFLDVKPGYSDNPTRAFYNHVWVIGDQEAIDVNEQAEVNELAELAKIGGEK